MHRWHRTIRLALAAFAVLFAVLVYFAIRPRPRDESARRTPRTDPKAVAESTGGVSLVAKGAKENFKVAYARARTYADGTLKFETVKVTVPRRDGRDFQVESKTATVTNNQAHIEMDGDVRLVASDGMKAGAARATYDNTAGVLRVPERITFSRGRMSGSAVGATWNREDDVLELLQRARIVMTSDAQGAGGLDIVSDTATFARTDRYIRFERHVTVKRETQIIEADRGTAFLAPDEDLLERVELRGNAKVVTPDAPPPSAEQRRGAGPEHSRARPEGALQAMGSRDMDLGYGTDGETLEHATLKGGASIQLAGAASQPGRRLTGEVIELGMAPDGSTLVSLDARGGVTLTIPGDGDTPARRIAAARLLGSGPPDKGITNARFSDNVEFRETRPAGKRAQAVDRTARSRTLETVVTPGFGTIDAATFGGGVTFHEPGRDASAADARYDVKAGMLQLAAGGEPGSAAARVDDAKATVQARRIDLRLDGGSLVADADVRSLLKSSSDRQDAGRAPGAPGSATVRRPGMLKDNQPVNVTAKHLDYDSAASRALYTGDARLWQGETAVQADSLAIDDAKGDLMGEGRVRSTLRLQQTDSKTGKTEPRTSVVTSSKLHYEDEKRRATYTENARMVGPEGDLHADRIELFLDATGDGLERLEAYDPVTLKTDQRTSYGTHLTYYADDERYVMSGAPVRVLEQLQQECRETIGKTLTFYRSADTISVDGNEESRTQSTSGGKCPEPRSK